MERAIATDKTRWCQFTLFTTSGEHVLHILGNTRLGLSKMVAIGMELWELSLPVSTLQACKHHLKVCLLSKFDNGEVIVLFCWG